MLMLMHTLVRCARRGIVSAPRPSPTPMLALALALALASPQAVHATALDARESARAAAIADAAPWAATRAGTRAASGTLGVQTLAVEDEPRKGAPPGERRARVYQHDHGTRRTRRVVVDLVTDSVVETRALGSPHLPLNDVERRWALGRLAADTPLVETLRDEQRRRGDPPFAALDELDVKASVFEPTDPAHPCARERCALLSLFDARRTVFAAEPLVRFADGTVVPLERSRRVP